MSEQCPQLKPWGGVAVTPPPTFPNPPHPHLPVPHPNDSEIPMSFLASLRTIAVFVLLSGTTAIAMSFPTPGKAASLTTAAGVALPYNYHRLRGGDPWCEDPCDSRYCCKEADDQF